ncbi:MAG TPA: AMP-binding protein, partial [Acidimicrobiales bacterium]|nr:AMP-binding protein [Acidimicrobiales bacterium]
MAEATLAPITLGRRLAQLAEERPALTAITFVHDTGATRDVLWLELEHWTNRLARLLAQRGVGEQSTVVVELPNCLEHFAVTIAAWKLGAMAVPVNAKLPPAERDAVLEVARATVVVADRDDPTVLRPTALAEADRLSADPLPDVVPHPGRAIASGGSTGRPKLIVDPNPAAYPVEAIQAMVNAWAGVDLDEVQLVSGPLYHNAPFAWAHIGLFLGHRLVVMEHFDAEQAVRLVETYKVTFAPLVPTTMQRILRLPDIRTRDLTSIKSVFHTAAPCPEWVKRGWIDLIGPERVYELFGATEAVGLCVIRGDEWLEHPGTVGRPAMDTELKILDDDGNEVPTGEVGEIYMRRTTASTTYEYKGSAPARSTADGFVSVGDLGWVDQDGYLHLADRRADLIISGGANIYPAEVELALAEHPAVCDSAVVGLPSEEWGKSVHAIVQPCDPENPPTVEELTRHCRERLAPYKVPKSWELVEQLP